MFWSDFDTFLKPIHLQGKPCTVKIERVELQDLHNPADPRRGRVPVLYFEGVPRGLILSDSNRRALQSLYGNSVKDCLGRRVTLTPVTIRVAGKDTETIRLGAPRR